MNSISIKDLLVLFIKNIVIILVVAIVFGAAGFVYCENFVPERYVAHGSILVTNGALVVDNSRSDTVQNTDIAASINLLATIQDLLKTPGIYQQLSDKIDNKYSYGQLRNAVSVDTQRDESLILSVSFELGTRKEAIDITNHFLKLAPEYITSHIIGSTAIVTAYSDSASQTAPKTAPVTILAAFVGAALTFLVVFLISQFNQTIKSDEDFSAAYDIPLWGNIPDFSTSHTNPSTKSKSQVRR